MERLPIGIIVLIVVTVLIYLGVAQRALDRMRLSDKTALAVIGAIVVGSFINIPLPFLPFTTSLNVGGVLVPVALAIYLIYKAGTRMEKSRALLGAGATAVVVYVIASIINTGHPEPAGRFAVIDAIYLYPLVGGVIGYIVGRSRRAAFVAATLGVLLVDVFHYIWLIIEGAPANYVVAIGGAGAFDTIVLAGIIAILLAELIGESFERLAGGPKAKGRPPELVKGLQVPGRGEPEIQSRGEFCNTEFDSGGVVTKMDDRGKAGDR